MHGFIDWELLERETCQNNSCKYLINPLSNMLWKWPSTAWQADLWEWFHLTSLMLSLLSMVLMSSLFRILTNVAILLAHFVALTVKLSTFSWNWFIRQYSWRVLFHFLFNWPEQAAIDQRLEQQFHPALQQDTLDQHNEEAHWLRTHGRCQNPEDSHPPTDPTLASLR